jgi:hypothetical protein
MMLVQIPFNASGTPELIMPGRRARVLSRRSFPVSPKWRYVMEPRREEKNTVEPRREEKPKRFRLVKLEERIAPSSNKITVGHGCNPGGHGGGCGSGSSGGLSIE